MRLRPAALAGVAVALSAQCWRPLWNDEVLQYVFGSYSSTAVAWKVFSAASEDILTGQTPAYILLDHWLLRAFGASRFWLRLPSLLTTMLLYASAVRLWSRWGLSERWRCLGVLALYATAAVTWHAGNARPYMPLAAATIAVLAYWSAPAGQRTGGDRVLGWTGMLTGALFHPYFPLYALGAWGIGVVTVGGARTARAIRDHLDPPLVISGAIVSAGLGSVSWMAHRLTRPYEPFAEIGHGLGAVRSLLAGHGGPIDGWWGGLILIGLAAAAWRTGGPRGRVAAATVGAAFALSLAVSFASWRASYPIFPRQWVASAALVAVAVPGLLAALGGSQGARLISMIVIITTGVGAVFAALEHIEDYAAEVKSYRQPAVDRSLKGMEPQQRWIELANENTRRGGEVWPIFRKYYLITGAGTSEFGE